MYCAYLERPNILYLHNNGNRVTRDTGTTSNAIAGRHNIHSTIVDRESNLIQIPSATSSPNTPTSQEVVKSLAAMQEKSNNISENQRLKYMIYCMFMFTALLLITNCVLIVFLINNDNDVPSLTKTINGDYNESSDNINSISIDLIEGLDSYLKSHCILHIDTDSAEEMDPFGQGITVIRNPIDIPSPINIAYSPLINDTTGLIEYFTELDSNDNLVAKPLCQTDFDNTTYSMKGNSYVFDNNLCKFPLPSWMTQQDILNLPRRTYPITHRIVLTTVEVVGELEAGHTFEFFTYNATIPGPPIRVRVGDWIDLTLINPNTSSHEHSIDFHGMTGPGGKLFICLFKNPANTK